MNCTQILFTLFISLFTWSVSYAEESRTPEKMIESSHVCPLQDYRNVKFNWKIIHKDGDQKTSVFRQFLTGKSYPPQVTIEWTSTTPVEIECQNEHIAITVRDTALIKIFLPMKSGPIGAI